jgi:hypothetical protein
MPYGVSNGMVIVSSDQPEIVKDRYGCFRLQMPTDQPLVTQYSRYPIQAMVICQQL